MKRLFILVVVLIAQSIPSVAESREKDLDRWVDRDLIPYVRQQLELHPRFKNETVMFVVLDDNAPASSTNALALSVRDRLLAAAVATPGVAVGWRQGRGDTMLGTALPDCLNDDVHYYIGIELSQKLDGSYALSARALDLEDQTWVTGFGRRWQGKLSTSQRQAMRQQRVDRTFLGARDVPYTLAQTDLLAAQLAHRLSCTLQKHVEDRYVVSVDVVEPPAPGLQGTVELISNNLANRQALKLSRDPSAANAILSGKAHRIAGALHQYWVTITPSGEQDDVNALSASAYIVLPESPRQAGSAGTDTAGQSAPSVGALASRPRVPPASIPNAGNEAFIGPLSIRSPASYTDCNGGACSVLETRANVDAVLFFLQHQANHGLVRLADAGCRNRTAVQVARSGEAIRFPIARTTTHRRDWTETQEWRLAPELDTFYALVVTDARIARKIANHVDRLPVRCGESLRPGLENEALRDWLDGLAMLAARDARYIDWRAIEVEDLL